MKNTRKMTNTIFAMLLGLLVIAASNQAFAQGGIWETKAPMPTARWYTAGGVVDGKLYVAGGSGTNSTSPVIPVDLLEVYDPATDTWATKAPMPTARVGAGAAVINGKFYVVGGDNGPKLATLEVYDPATDAWATKAPMPTVRGWAGVAVVNGLIYVMGGGWGWDSSDSELKAKTIEVYNPTTNTWTTKAQHPVGVGSTAGSINGKIYVAGNTTTAGALGTSEVYDPATDTWASLSPMPTARYIAAGGVINGKLYVAGGTDASYVPLATLEAFTPGLITPTPVTTPSPAATPTATPTPQPSPTPLSTPPPTLPPPQGGAGIIFGFINDADDNALQGVTVTLDGADSSESVTTDEEGYFEFKNLSAGDYTLTCEKEGYQTYTQSISLGNDEIQEIETIVLEEVVKAKISGYVVDIKGDPIENVRIKAKGIKTGYKKTAASDADGFFEFDELDGDTYIIVAKKKGYKRAKQTVRLDDGEETEIEIEMKKTSKRIIKASAL